MKKLMIQTLLLFLAILISGCNTGGPKIHTEPKIDLNLPTPQDVKTMSGVNSIAIEWSKIRDNTITGFIIYRSKNEGKLLEIGRVESRFSTHYLDSNLQPNQEYNYRIASFDNENFQSEPSKSIIVKTKNVPEATVIIASVPNLPRMAKIIFRPHTDVSINGYLIQRKNIIKKEWKDVGEIEGRLNAEFIDYDLNDEQEYRYRIFAIRFDDIKSYPSKIITTTTKKLPKKIENIKATSTLPKKIKITWTPIEAKEDLSYNIYTADEMDDTFKKKIVLKNRSEFIDILEKDGQVVYYKITATDKDGLESKLPKNSAKGSTKNRPLTPTVISASIIDSVPVIEWVSSDENVVEFKILRVKKTGFLSEEDFEFTDIKDKKFKDVSEGFVPNVDFTYSVVAIDIDGIESVPSEPKKIKYILKKEDTNK